MCPLNQLCAPRQDDRDGKKRGPPLFPYFLVHVFICFEEKNLPHSSSIRIILAFPDLCFSPWLRNEMAKLPFPTIMFQSYQSNVALPLPARSFNNYPNIGIGEWRGINTLFGHKQYWRRNMFSGLQSCMFCLIGQKEVFPPIILGYFGTNLDFSICILLNKMLFLFFLTELKRCDRKETFSRNLESI